MARHAFITHFPSTTDLAPPESDNVTPIQFTRVRTRMFYNIRSAVQRGTGELGPILGIAALTPLFSHGDRGACSGLRDPPRHADLPPDRQPDERGLMGICVSNIN